MVIILNEGVIAKLVYICRCALAVISWHSDSPFCRDATQGAYAAALIGLAEYTVTDNLASLFRHKETLRFPSLSDYDKTTVTFCQTMELFILLHEYGHVVRGHLTQAELRSAFGGQFASLQEYSKSEAQEFEADEYAIERMLASSGQATGSRPSDTAFGPGLVMKFFELCELLAPSASAARPRTHPSARDRWQRIKVQTRLRDAPDALANNLDPAFDTIQRVFLGNAIRT